MSTSILQRYVKTRLVINFGGYAVEENVRPGWLIASDGSRLELDFYIKEYGVAVEVQGRQHYQFVPSFHKDHKGFSRQLYCDSEKKRVCCEVGVKLFEIYNIEDCSDVIRGIRQIAYGKLDNSKISDLMWMYVDKRTDVIQREISELMGLLETQKDNVDRIVLNKAKKQLNGAIDRLKIETVRAKKDFIREIEPLLLKNN